MDLIELLQRLALNDEHAVRLAIGATAAPRAGAALDGRTNALVQLAALLSLGAATCSCRVAVEVARTHGATDAELVGVLVAVAPALGGAGVVAAAPRLARAIDHDVEAWDAPPR